MFVFITLRTGGLQLWRHLQFTFMFKHYMVERDTFPKSVKISQALCILCDANNFLLFYMQKKRIQSFKENIVNIFKREKENISFMFCKKSHTMTHK